MARMEENSLVRRVAEGRPEGRRPVGRPRLRWVDCVKSDLTLLGVNDPHNWMIIARDRRRWRLLVQAAKDHPGPALHGVRVSKYGPILSLMNASHRF